jgi:hypothetical protein
VPRGPTGLDPLVEQGLLTDLACDSALAAVLGGSYRQLNWSETEDPAQRKNA